MLREQTDGKHLPLLRLDRNFTANVNSLFEINQTDTINLRLLFSFSRKYEFMNTKVLTQTSREVSY